MPPPEERFPAYVLPVAEPVAQPAKDHLKWLQPT